MWPHDRKDMWLWESLNLSRHCAKFDAYRFCGSGDMLLFCHLTSGEHMIKGTYRSCEIGDTFLFHHVKSHDLRIKGACDFVSGSPSTCFTTLLNLMLIGLAGVDIYIYIYLYITFLFRHATSQDHMIKRTFDVVDGNPLPHYQVRWL